MRTPEMQISRTTSSPLLRNTGSCFPPTACWRLSTAARLAQLRTLQREQSSSIFEEGCKHRAKDAVHTLWRFVLLPLED